MRSFYRRLLSGILAVLTVLFVCTTTSLAAEHGGETSKWDGVIPQNVTALSFSTLNGSSTHAGLENNPYLIKSAEDLVTLASYVNSGNGAKTSGVHYRLCCDIDMDGKPWAGIGTKLVASDTANSTAFQGIFDGNGRVIYNLELADVKSGERISTGLFGFVSTQGACIKNLGIASGEATVTISVDNGYVGTLVGYLDRQADIKNCFSAASLTVTVSKRNSFIGGLVGYIGGGYNEDRSDIIGCQSVGKIIISEESSSEAANIRLGGIVGAVANNTSIQDCASMGEIRQNGGSANTDSGFGQIVGYMSVSGKTLSCKNVYAGGNIYVTASAVNYGKVFGLANAITLNIVGVHHEVSVYKANALYSSADVCGKFNGSHTAQDYIAESNMLASVEGVISNGFAQNNVAAKKIRFASELMFSKDAFKQTGYEIKFGSSSADLNGKIVYSSLKVDGEKNNIIKPELGKYYITYGLSGIPDNASGTLTVTPYVVLLDGSTRIYGKSAEYPLQNGVLTANAEVSSEALETKVYWNTSYDDVQYTHYRLPNILVTNQDTVIVYGEARNQNINSDGSSNNDECLMDIYIRRSTDGGVTFREPIYIAKGTEYMASGYGETLNNPCMTVGDDGTLHLLFCSDVGKKGIFYTYSTDDGITWSQPKNIKGQLSSVSYQMLAFGPGNGVCLDSGRLVVSAWMYYSSEYHVYPVYSDDGGATWKIGEEVSNNKNETCIAKTSDGGVIFNSRQHNLPTDEAHTQAPYRVLSYSSTGIDGWTALPQNQTLIDPACSGGMTSAVLSDGSHVMLFVNNASTTDRKNVTVKYSFDDGETWNTGVTIDADNGGYSNIAVDSQGRVYVIYEQTMGTKLILATFGINSILN